MMKDAVGKASSLFCWAGGLWFLVLRHWNGLACHYDDKTGSSGFLHFLCLFLFVHNPHCWR